MTLIERLKELEAKATPGPWNWDKCGKGFLLLVEYDGKGIPWVLDGIVEDREWGDASITGKRADMDLIAEMRNALPKLLAVVEAAKLSYETQPTSSWEIDYERLGNSLNALNQP